MINKTVQEFKGNWTRVHTEPRKIHLEILDESRAYKVKSSREWNIHSIMKNGYHVQFKPGLEK